MLAASPLTVIFVDDPSENADKQSKDAMAFVIAFVPRWIKNPELEKSYELFQMDSVIVELFEGSRSSIRSFKTPILVA